MHVSSAGIAVANETVSVVAVITAAPIALAPVPRIVPKAARCRAAYSLLSQFFRLESTFSDK